MTMRLLLLASRYPPFVGGAELQAQRLARQLDAIGVRVTVLTQPCAGQSSSDHEGGVRVLRVLNAVPLGPLWGLTYAHSCWRWHRRLVQDWDVVHNQQVALHSWVSVRAAASLGKPSLLRFACTGEGGDLSVLRAQRFGEHLVRGLRNASRFIALTSTSAEEIRQFGLPGDRIRMIPNGVDLDRFPIQPWQVTDAAEPLRLLFVGRLDMQKGLDILLEALATVPHPERFRLRIVGEGRERENLQAHIARRGLQNVVELCGVRSNVVAEYAWSEAVVLPSRFEGMPNVVLEAMACARPVLGTRVGGTADLVVEGSTGWLANSADVASLASALVQVDAQRHALQSMGARGRAVAEAQYSLRQMASAYAREYEDLLRTRRPECAA